MSSITSLQQELLLRRRFVPVCSVRCHATPLGTTNRGDPECPCLGVRTRGSTSEGTWLVQRRVKGRSRRQSLGPVRGLSRDEARKLAVEIIGRARPAEPVLAPLLEDFVPTFLADCAGRWKSDTRCASRQRLCV